MPAAAWKTACITLSCNVILGNMVLAWVPLAVIRFNYTWSGLGLPTSITAVALLTISFCLIRGRRTGFKACACSCWWAEHFCPWPCPS